MTPITIDSEFKSLLSGDVRLEAFAISPKVVHVEILPHTQDGYYHVNVVDDGYMMDFTKRGFNAEMVALMLQSYDVDINKVEWKVSPSSRYYKNPWDNSKEPRKQHARNSSDEKEIENEIVSSLGAYNPRQQVACASGIADIVTDYAVIEVKVTLDRDTLFRAIGQVLSYRQSINPALRAQIIALYIDDNAKEIAESARALGVEVIEWHS